MTAVAAPTLPRPRFRRMRPALVLGAALAVVVGSYGLAALRPATTPQPAQRAAIRDQPALSGPADAPTGGSKGIAAIDHALKAWTSNLARNDKDFLSATYIATLYEARGRLTG